MDTACLQHAERERDEATPGVEHNWVAQRFGVNCHLSLSPCNSFGESREVNFNTDLLELLEKQLAQGFVSMLRNAEGAFAVNLFVGFGAADKRVHTDHRRIRGVKSGDQAPGPELGVFAGGCAA